MNTETFNKLLDELDGNSLKTLKQRNAKYASSDDCLHNFDSGADISGFTPAQCAWGYMTKHLAALRDKIQKNDFSDREDLLEKCQDIINYIRFIWLIGNADRAKYTGINADGTKMMNDSYNESSNRPIGNSLTEIKSCIKDCDTCSHGNERYELRCDHCHLFDKWEPKA